jgi:hypothetical protein
VCIRALRYRGKLLDETETHLVHSAENAKAVSAKAKEQYRQGNWNLCHTCIIVLSVFVIFTVMIVAIRVSEAAGGRGGGRGLDGAGWAAAVVNCCGTAACLTLYCSCVSPG